jgi:tetratricopeptide (TPR) repeat protein
MSALYRLITHCYRGDEGLRIFDGMKCSVILSLLCSLLIGTEICGQSHRHWPAADSAIKAITSQADTMVNQSIALFDSLLLYDVQLRKHPICVADLLLEKSRKEQKAGKLEASVQSLTEAFHLYDSLNHDKGKAGALINLGVLNIILNKPATAREYLEHALRFKTDITDMLMARIYINMGVSYDMEGQTATAIRLYETALPYAQRTGDSEALATTYHSIGIAYAMAGDFRRSEPYELKALKSNPSPKLRSQILGSLGSFYQEYGQPEKAEECLLEAISIAEREQYWDVLLTCYLSLSDFYTSLKREAEAVSPLKKYIHLKDSITTFSEEEKRSEQEARFRFDLQRKALEVSELKRKNQNRWSIAVSIISVLLLVIAGVSYRNYQLKRKANLLLEEEKKRIENEKSNLQEENLMLQKENLTAKFETLKSQINPHFLFNALNSLYALVGTDTKRSQDFIMQFSQLYRKVLEFNDMPVVSLKQELDLVNHYLFLQQIRFGNNLRVRLDIDPSLIEYFIPPFALQILLENAVKHNIVSAEQALEVIIRTNSEDHSLIVSNTLNRKKDPDLSSTGTGLKNIMRRYEILSDRKPEFRMDRNYYLAILPLLKEE